MDAYPAMARSAKFQHEADHHLYAAVLRERYEDEATLAKLAFQGPNLLIETSPHGTVDRLILPVLTLKTG